jgi:hypothetical protein
VHFLRTNGRDIISFPSESPVISAPPKYLATTERESPIGTDSEPSTHLILRNAQSNAGHTDEVKIVGREMEAVQTACMLSSGARRLRYGGEAGLQVRVHPFYAFGEGIVVRGNGCQYAEVRLEILDVEPDEMCVLN